MREASYWLLSVSLSCCRAVENSLSVTLPSLSPSSWVKMSLALVPSVDDRLENADTRSSSSM